MKTCTKCGEVKAITEFSKHAQNRDKLHTRCKACASVANVAWRAANREKIKAYKAAHRADNREQIKAYKAAWIAANPDYRADNREKINAYHAAWSEANPEAHRIHCHNYRARKIENGGQLSTDVAERLYKLQRGKCACGCGQPLGDNYHRDHIMPLALGGANEDWNIQLLRQRCNNQKHAKHPIDFMQQRGFLL